VIRVHVICEGQTEETFVKNLLAKPFAQREIYLIPSLIGKPGHKGGNVTFDRLLRDTKIRLMHDKSCYCTTFFDFYALPTDFPGKADAAGEVGISDKASTLCEKLVENLSPKVGDTNMLRFIPYVQMYEFEALLFSDPKGFAQGIDIPTLEADFTKIRNAFRTPEEINDSPVTAPSKRVEKLVPKYEKPLYGTLAALEIGLSKMRNECALFNAWLTRLEQLKS
jgi:hypothetical protein